MHFTHFLIIYKLLLVHSAVFEVNLKINTESGRMVIFIQFFALISNLKSEFENLRRVFFYCLLYFLMPYCRLI